MPQGEPTIDQIDALVGPATPHFAYQLRARVEELVLDLPEDHEVRRYAEQKMELLDRLGHASTKAARGPEGAARRSRAGRRFRAPRPPTSRCRAAMSSFEGASVLVTGGSRGIGKAIALRFAEQGAARVAIGYLRNDRAAEETAEELRAAGAEPLLLRGSVASERVAAEAAELGPFDVLVHNAATGVIKPALETEDKHWDWTLSANARALLTLARACVPQMPEGSSIVGVSSLGSIRVMENYVLVGVSKAALEALVRYLAVELAPRKIRVNAVSAGVVETGALEHFPNREEMISSGLARTPAGPAGRAGRHRGRGLVPLLARRPRWSAATR